MWINSPLGKWEQENRVIKALDDAARMRAQEKDLDANDSARRGSLLGAASAPLLWLAARARETVQSIQIWLAAPSAPWDQFRSGTPGLPPAGEARLAQERRCR